ncbi:hypothetical protein I3842_02G020900 [Carya illinoinensis]|uniref:DUF4408 domain-containing protein n=1 Tax=Carya illinoinensis TaxID=32201 RepID=A0A922JYS9_CARIL|nr:hypothetical protein I3842_02G020900 [Carya illinoinensis]
MDFFDYDNHLAEKESCQTYPSNQEASVMFRIAKLFRYVELFLALVFVSWSFLRVPLAVRISGEYFWKLLSFVASPLFVFMLCNVIIVILITKSGRFPGHEQPGDKADTELYEKFIKNSDDSTKPESETDPPVHAPEVIEYQDKQIICEVNRTARADDSQKYSDKGTDLMHPKACQRTQSEKLEGEGSEKYAGKLRRTEKEKCLKAANSEENRPENPCPEDEMSNEDFQRTIEAFIAKQRKFRRQESLPIVVHNQIGVPVGN